MPIRRKDEFLAILGHELRNPLSPIRNAAQVLELVNSDDPRVTWARETITRQVDHMTHLVDDLLDIARLTRGTLTLRKATVDMAEVVRHAVDSTKPLIDERKHQFTISIADEPLLVHGDSGPPYSDCRESSYQRVKIYRRGRQNFAGCPP